MEGSIMEMFAGLDVSLAETSVCVVDQEGKIVRETKVASEPEALRSALEDCADRLGRVGIEASSLGVWLHRELSQAGLPERETGSEWIFFASRKRADHHYVPMSRPR
jgi:hypothetical protein